jgi:hypothetical protein
MTPELEAARNEILKALPVACLVPGCKYCGESEKSHKALALLVSAIESRQWISLKSKKPTDERTYLFVNRIHLPVIGAWIQGRIIVDGEIVNATHWMPLPGHPVEIVEP